VSARVRIVYNRLLGGWYIVRGPHQTPLGGRFDSKEAAQQHLIDAQKRRDHRNPSVRIGSTRGKAVLGERRLRSITRDPVRGAGAYSHYFVQVKRGARWIALASFPRGEFGRARALEYGKLLARRYPRQVFRVEWPDERYIAGGKKVFNSLKEATDYANRIAKTTGSIIAVEKYRGKKNPKARLKFFVGIKGAHRTVFKHPAIPTEMEYGARYNAVLGPFRSKAAAEMAARPHGPLLQHVSDFERAVRKKNPAPRERNGSGGAGVLVMEWKTKLNKYGPQNVRDAPLVRQIGTRTGTAYVGSEDAVAFSKRAESLGVALDWIDDPFMRNPAARQNGAGVDAAARLFAQFTGHKVAHAKRVRLPSDPVGLAIGPVLGISYETTRDGKREKYLHEFRRGARPTLAASSDGRRLYLLRGAYRFTERGIVDKR
jgi:hypothetical protein